MKKIRIEVRNKKGEYDAVVETLKRDVKDIGINVLKDAEYIEVYTLSGEIEASDADRIAFELLADRVIQEYNIAGGFVPVSGVHSETVEVAYNPGVMDPVQESAMKAVHDMGIDSVDSVETSKKFILYGDLTKADAASIADKLLYNKIIQHVVVSEEKDKEIAAYEFKAVYVDIVSMSDKDLMNLSKKGQLYLNLVEMKAIKDYFKKIKRNPTDCELETIAQTWSEHCKHKTMRGDIVFNGKKIKNLLGNTVMKVTKELNKKWCVSVFKDNAGVIRFDKDNNVCFKVETHNHPSALEPYGGSETGVGGVIRDCMGTGRGAKPIANTDVFCFGIPDADVASVPKGALHPKRVMKGVVGGVRDYGNKMGIPTVNGAICFDERYTGNPLVFCGNVGIMPKKFSTKKVSPGDLIVAIGGRTGRDGIHGATFSSAELTAESEVISSTAVQIGNPITEKKMVDTLIKARDLELYEAITDCGAGGFSSAVGEMGEDTGAEVYLERAPLKYQGLKPWEIWISEAQERMVLAVKPKKLKALLDIFKSENVEATVIGNFTNDKKLRIYFKDHKITELDMKFLHDGLPYTAKKAKWKAPKENKEITFKLAGSLTDDLKKVIAGWNVCSKEWVVRQYDHEVQGGSVLKPFIGVYRDAPSDAAIIRPVLDSVKGVVISNGINPCYGDIDPYWMAASAIDEALRQVAAVGGDLDKVAILDNFCWGNSDDQVQLGKLVRASYACYDIAKAYGTPFISGKDSFNNEFNTGKKTVAIPSTLLISAIGVIDDVSKTVSADIKESGNLLYVIGKTYQEMGASQYFAAKKVNGGVVPRVRPKTALKTMERVVSAIKKGFIRSCHDCSEGGIAVSLSEMLFGADLGAEISLHGIPCENSVKRDDVLLFSESNSRFIVEIPARCKTKFEKHMKGIDHGLIGEVNGTGKLTVSGLSGKVVVDAEIEEVKSFWKTTIRKVMHE
ncbi:MAG TPA: phosphoribosylformylglycinamidine synthase subunit PurL [Candidatus Omnitrophota bacterium]|nr:phosphoribosylformylglycinamidine synthase subunit PurL [Candidatus Omnitrophota bacterium]HPS21074.1 phosphoribosylformylglycinamidine synthase subunit PurL [Candidatus Omnitrophota bacterium]